MKNILFIGGAGFIGSNIIAQLNSMGYNYRMFVLEPEFASLHRLDGIPVTIIRGGIGNVDMVKNIILDNKIDTVIHLVSTLIPGSTFEDYQREFVNVIFPTIKLMEICGSQGILFVYLSSGGTVYGDRKGNEVPFNENDIMAPISFYGWSKQMMENSILFMHRTKNLKYLIIRPSNPYGKGQNLHGKQGLIAVALGKILSGKTIQIWGDGSLIRDYIYIDDLGKAIIDVLLMDSIVNETLNIGSGVGYSINDIINVLKEVVKENVLVEHIASRQVDVSSVVLDTSKLKNLILFQPRDIAEGISNFYRYVENLNS